MLSDLVRKNRSYRGYDESRRVTRGQLEALVELARLCPSSINLQPLKYVLSCEDKTNARIRPLIGWAGRLKDKRLPYPGHHPTAYIVVCFDETVTPFAPTFLKDVGIVSQTMLLGAAEAGLGGCMIGNFSPQKLREALCLPDTLAPQLVIALGTPDETIVLTDAAPGTDVGYYRDGKDIHYVPKRSIEESIITLLEV